MAPLLHRAAIIESSIQRQEMKRVKLLINCQGVRDKRFPKSVSTRLFRLITFNVSEFVIKLCHVSEVVNGAIQSSWGGLASWGTMLSGLLIDLSVIRSWPISEARCNYCHHKWHVVIIVIINDSLELGDSGAQTTHFECRNPQNLGVSPPNFSGDTYEHPIGSNQFQNIMHLMAKFHENQLRDVEKSVDRKKRKK